MWDALFGLTNFLAMAGWVVLAFLPRKPLADIAGLPMIVQVWRRAVEADVGPVVVAADSPEIVAVVTAAPPASRCARTNSAFWMSRISATRCQRESGSFSAMCLSTALAMPRLPSEFSKSIGLTLCGMVDEPISPAMVRCLK